MEYRFEHDHRTRFDSASVQATVEGNSTLFPVSGAIRQGTRALQPKINTSLKENLSKYTKIHVRFQIEELLQYAAGQTTQGYKNGYVLYSKSVEWY